MLSAMLSAMRESFPSFFFHCPHISEIWCSQRYVIISTSSFFNQLISYWLHQLALVSLSIISQTIVQWRRTCIIYMWASSTYPKFCVSELEYPIKPLPCISLALTGSIIITLGSSIGDTLDGARSYLGWINGEKQMSSSVFAHFQVARHLPFTKYRISTVSVQLSQGVIDFNGP
jgi:hypothetical protein